MMQLINNQNLIGDLTGTVPVMTDLAKKYGGLKVKQTLDEGKWIYPFIKYLGIELIDEIDERLPYFELDIEKAFNFSMENKTYMSQSWHEQVGLPTPEVTPRPELDFPDVEVPIYDYVLAPFSRSTPENEKWEIQSWQALGWQLDGTVSKPKVCVFGNSKYDKPIDGLNNEFDRPMVEVLNILKKCRKGCISINTGISHLCFATGTKNYLLNNQGQGWAINPEAISIETYIPRITVDEMLDFIKNN